jgi:hypothetical protein
MTCGGSLSWCGFAQVIFARAGALLDGKMPVVHAILPKRTLPKPNVLKTHAISMRSGAHASQSTSLPGEAALDEAMRRLTSPQPHVSCLSFPANLHHAFKLSGKPLAAVHRYLPP